MNDVPGWIQLLYKRHTPEYALQTAFLLDFVRGSVAEQADAQPDGREQLRQIAVRKVESHDPQTVAWSLICLGVVGLPEDLSMVERFIAHPSDSIQRAARACQFQLKKNGRD
jgi:hypothetical protein